MHNVSCAQTQTGICLSGLMDNVYNLRSEVNSVLLWQRESGAGDTSRSPANVSTSTSTSASPNPATPSYAGSEGGSYPPLEPHSMPVSAAARPPPGMPAHLQPQPFRENPAHSTALASLTTATPRFNPRSPLQPPSFNPSAQHSQNLPTDGKASHNPDYLATEGDSSHNIVPSLGYNDIGLHGLPSPHTDGRSHDLPSPHIGSSDSHNQDGSLAVSSTSPNETNPSKSYSYAQEYGSTGVLPKTDPKQPAASHEEVPASLPSQPSVLAGTSSANDLETGTGGSRAKTPPPSGQDSEETSEEHNANEEMSNEFTNLNPNALALLQRLSDGDIQGIEYDIKRGCIRLVLHRKGDREEALSKFQSAYKNVAVRHLRVESVDVPQSKSREEVLAEIDKFEQKYKFCAFVLEEEKQQVKVISQSRQFEQAKQFFKNALHGTASTDNAAAAPMVIVLPTKRTLTLKKADIVQEKVDMIVNAANGHLLHGGGVAGALNAASQGMLQRYCNRYREQRNGVEIPVGDVIVTHAGGELKCEHVIHAVGPSNISHSPSQSERLIKRAILNSLRVSEHYNALSIAIPALSSGIFGVSKDLVAQSVTDVILEFSFTKPMPVLSDIRIVIIDEPTHSSFARYFQKKMESHNTAPKESLPQNDHNTSNGKGKMSI